MEAVDSGVAARAPQIVAIGGAQLVAWASSIYLPAVIVRPQAAELGVGSATVFAACSLALLIAALVAPAIGRTIDRRGGREVLVLSNLVLATGLTGLGFSVGPVSLLLAWTTIGLGIALGLYDAAFAALVRQHGAGARSAIIGITLLGGFASTVGWPLTAWWQAEYGWRAACLLWAALHLFVALPLNALFIPRLPRGQPLPQSTAGRAAPDADEKRKLALLAVFGAATAVVTSAMATHLPALLMASGLGVAAAIAAASAVGAAQVAARFAEFALARYRPQPPLRMAKLATALHPLGAAGLLAAGATAPLAAVFTTLHGAGNGMITIAKGTLPLTLFGAGGYGARLGLLTFAHRLAQATAPFLYGLVLDDWGAPGGLAVSTALSMVALGSLLAIGPRQRT